MSELKAVHAFDVYEAYTKTGDDDAAQVYLKSEADKVIAELKDKCNMHDFFWEGCGFAKRGFKNSIAVSEAFEKLEAENKRLEKCCKEYDSRQRIDERIKFNGAQQLRATKHALWLARASEAKKEVNYWTCQDESSYAIVDFNVRHETIVSYKAPHHRPYKWILIWENVERKCRIKAKEYK